MQQCNELAKMHQHPTTNMATTKGPNRDQFPEHLKHNDISAGINSYEDVSKDQIKTDLSRAFETQ
jgi:hypothetical protein